MLPTLLQLICANGLHIFNLNLSEFYVYFNRHLITHKSWESLLTFYDLKPVSTEAIRRIAKNTRK